VKSEFASAHRNVVENNVYGDSASGRSLRYGELAAEAAKIALAAEPAIKTPDKFTLMGQPTKRLDVPVKIDGSAQYGIDIKVPDMVYAAVIGCPVVGGKVKSVDAAAVKALHLEEHPCAGSVLALGRQLAERFRHRELRRRRRPRFISRSRAAANGAASASPAPRRSPPRSPTRSSP